MHLDDHKYPCTLNPDGSMDKNDQLQRVAMIFALNNFVANVPEYEATTKSIQRDFEVHPGIYARYPGGRTTDLSGDSLISILAAWIRRQEFHIAWDITKQIILRGGFSQNIYDMYGSETKKTPDFILVRAYPLLWRSSPTAFVFRWLAFCIFTGLALLKSPWFFFSYFFVTDLILLVFALTSWLPVWKDGKGFEKRTMDDVDDNVIILTFLTCASTFPTFFSSISPKIYAKLRPKNYGQEFYDNENPPRYKPVMGALRWYHRAPAGNPEIPDMYKAPLEKYFGEHNPEVSLA